MNNLTKISIIIPVYNVAEYIAECIQSVMRQTYEGAIECIVVDDCSPDNSMTIIEQIINEYKGSISFSVLHHNRNRGLSAARNTGMKEAKGDYIYFLDSDDYISDDCIEVLTRPLKEREYDMIVGDIQIFGEKQGLPFLYEKRSEILGNTNIFDSYANRLIYVMACNKLCKLSFLRNNNISFLEGQLHEDEMWTYKIMSYIDSLAICHSTTYFYRIRGGSIIQTDNLVNGKKANAYFETFQYITQHPYKNRGLYEKVVAFYAKLYLSIAFASHTPFYSRYKYVRAHFSLNDNNHKFGIKAHFYMPVCLGYCYAKIWSGVKKILS